MRFCAVLVAIVVFGVYEFGFWLFACDDCRLICCVVIGCSLLLLVVLIWCFGVFGWDLFAGAWLVFDWC